MNVTKLRLVSASVVELPILSALPTDKYILKNVDGLGSPERTLSISNGMLQAAEPQDRQIVARVGLNPDWTSNETASDLREHFYAMLSGAVTVNVMDDETVQCKTVGHVQRIEIVPFSKDPEIQITIACLDPYLYAPTSIATLPTLDSSGPTPLWVVTNVGSAPVGFHAVIKINASPGTDLILYRDPIETTPQNVMSLGSFAFATNDRVHVNTIDGELDVYVIRGATTINLLSYMSSEYQIVQWFSLLPGVNKLGIVSPYPELESFSYTPRYWGI